MGLRLDLQGTYNRAYPGFEYLTSRGFMPPSGQTSQTLLGTIVGGGLDILGDWLKTKYAPQQPIVQPMGFQFPTDVAAGLPVPTGATSIAAIAPMIVAAGGRIVGTVIRITRAAWAAIPGWVKTAAAALGLTVAFTDVEAALPGEMVVRKRRRRGITAAELRGFKRMTCLLGRVGMVPKGLRGARVYRKRRCKV
jgi:hypothetical protein